MGDPLGSGTTVPPPPSPPVVAADGTTREVSYTAGETRHNNFAPGEFLLHEIKNIGDEQLVFTTVEHLGSANTPLQLD